MLLMLMAYVLFRGESFRFWELGIVGLASGILILITPSFFFTWLFTCAWIVVRARKMRFRALLVVVVFTLAVTTPWMLRNYRVFRSFVFVSTNGGVNLLLGNSEHTTPSSGVVDISKYEAEARHMTEVDRDRYFRKEALAFMREHPGRTARLYVLKFLNYFDYENRIRTEQETSRWRSILALVSYWPLLALGLVIPLLFYKKIPWRPFQGYFLLLYVLNGAFSAVFFTRVRFRIPFDVLLICSAVVFADRLLADRKGKAEKCLAERPVNG
jgi:hypothetical protein